MNIDAGAAVTTIFEWRLGLGAVWVS